MARVDSSLERSRRVLDAQHERAAVVAREEVAEERGAHAPDVERAGGAWAKRVRTGIARTNGWRPHVNS